MIHQQLHIRGNLIKVQQNPHHQLDICTAKSSFFLIQTDHSLSLSQCPICFGFWYAFEISLHLRMCPIGKTYSPANTFPNTFEAYRFTLIAMLSLRSIKFSTKVVKCNYDAFPKAVFHSDKIEKSHLNKECKSLSQKAVSFPW